VTYQINQANKLTVYRDQFWRYQSHFGGAALMDWAKVPRIYGLGTQYFLPIKYTSTLTNKLLLEAGWSHWGYDNTIFQIQPGVEQPYGSPAWYANAGRYDLVTGLQTTAFSESPGNGGYCCYRYIQPANVYQAAMSYVTGSHQVKAGFSHKSGYQRIITQETNAALVQRYRNGVPDSVSVAAHPSDAQSKVNHEAGIYVQDRWTMKRLTVNAGIRYEIVQAGVGATSSAAGRFIPARTTPELLPWPTFKDWAPRFNVVYDLFGNAKTALKASAGKYLSITGATQVALYNPIGISSDVRNWSDRDLSGLSLATNGDNIAQDNEIAPSTNPRFGRAADLRADPNLAREYSWDYSIGVQHEILPRVSVAATWYHTTNKNLWANQDAFYTVNNWTRIDIANPCSGDPKCGAATSVATIPVFNLNPGTRTGDLVTRSSDVDKRIYNGLEFSGQARLSGGTTIIAGFFTEHTVARTCDRNNPNQLRFCDQFGELFQELGATSPPPYRNEFKLSVSQPLPWSLIGSVSFLSYANAAPPTAASSFTAGSVVGTGAPIDYLGADYALPAVLPGGVSRTIPVTVALVAPGTLYFDRWNQLDISVKRQIKFGRYSVTPSFELYNALNSSVVVNALQIYGATYLRPTSTLPGRLMRLGGQFRF
jgi:hypothetical protein